MFGLVLSSLFCQAQIYPIQSKARLIPPYGVYLPDYASPGQEKLQVILLLRDLTQASLDIRLRTETHHNGRLLMRTSYAYNPVPITLFPGQPTIILSDELLSNKEIQILASDLRINNLEIDPYLKKAKTEGKNEEEMIAEVKTSIINLISQIIAKIYEKPD